MKKALIIHGWDGNPKEPLHTYLKVRLESLGLEVSVPAMPNPATPFIDDWVREVGENFDNQDIIIGHSIGCQAVLRFLETLSNKTKVPLVLLIAPWMELDAQTMAEEGEGIIAIAKPWMETPIDFNKVKSNIEKIVAIFSDNDPYVPLDQANLFKKELGADIYIEKNQGHFTVSDGFQKLEHFDLLENFL